MILQEFLAERKTTSHLRKQRLKTTSKVMLESKSINLDFFAKIITFIHSKSGGERVEQ